MGKFLRICAIVQNFMQQSACIAEIST